MPAKGSLYVCLNYRVSLKRVPVYADSLQCLPPCPVPQVPELCVPHRQVEITTETSSAGHTVICWWNTSRNTWPLPCAGIFSPRALRQSPAITVAFSCLSSSIPADFRAQAKKGEKGGVIHGHHYSLLSGFSPKNISHVSAPSHCKSCSLVLSLYLAHPAQQVYAHAL